jgi:hypothetical protein
MTVFLAIIATALFLRHKREAHKRLMLLAYTAILVAAVARFPGVLPLGPFWFYGLTFLPILASCITYELVTRRLGPSLFQYVTTNWPPTSVISFEHDIKHRTLTLSLDSSDRLVLQNPYYHATILGLSLGTLVSSNLPRLSHRARCQHPRQRHICFLS